MRATSPRSAARGAKESESTVLPPPLVTELPPLSKSRLPRMLLTWTSAGRRWCRSVPGPVTSPKSPWDLAHTCSRFQSPTSPPLSDLLRETPLYSRITLPLLFGSWSVTLSAFQTAEYEIFVWLLMIVCSEDLRLVPVLPAAFL